MESETDFESDLTDADSSAIKKITLNNDAVKKHKCPYEGCVSAFNRPWKLVRHFNTHTKERPFKCDFPGCSKDYMNSSHLQRHISISHKAKTSSLQVFLLCPFPDCKKMFANKWSLKKHINLHKKIYSCQFCSSQFKKNWQLKQHMFIHSGLKSFNCKTCDESFETKTNLKIHERLHNPYKCDQEDCFEVFFTFNALRKHKKIVHPQWMQCDFCGTSFLNKWSLTQHVLSHLPNESREVFLCPYKDCERHYFHNKNLNHHIRSFHENIKHTCTTCGERFVNKSKLRNHSKHHAQPSDMKVNELKQKTARKPRKDKGKPRKNFAAFLSGVKLPPRIEKNLTQKNITSEVLEYIENLKNEVNKNISHKS